MTDYITNDTDLTSVANAIRVKAEISGSLEFPSGFITAINSISGGVTNVAVGTFTPAETDAPGALDVDTGYTGNGYPIAYMVFKNGIDTIRGTDCHVKVKKDMTTAPTYNMDVVNQGFYSCLYCRENGSHSAQGGAGSVYMYGQNALAGSYATCIVMSSKNTLKVSVNTDTDYALQPNETYKYVVLYSE